MAITSDHSGTSYDESGAPVINWRTCRSSQCSLTCPCPSAYDDRVLTLAFVGAAC